MKMSRPRTWGGAMTGRQMLNPTASHSGPCRAISRRPLRSSALPQMKLRGSSSIGRVPKVRCSMDRNRSPRISAWRGRVRWRSARRRTHSSKQIASISSASSGSGMLSSSAISATAAGRGRRCRRARVLEAAAQRPVQRQRQCGRAVQKCGEVGPAYGDDLGCAGGAHRAQIAANRSAARARPARPRAGTRRSRRRRPHRRPRAGPR